MIILPSGCRATATTVPFAPVPGLNEASGSPPPAAAGPAQISRIAPARRTKEAVIIFFIGASQRLSIS
jgi:hypothetical protein